MEPRDATAATQRLADAVAALERALVRGDAEDIRRAVDGVARVSAAVDDLIATSAPPGAGDLAEAPPGSQGRDALVLPPDLARAVGELDRSRRRVRALLEALAPVNQDLLAASRSIARLTAGYDPRGGARAPRAARHLLDASA